MFPILAVLNDLKHVLYYCIDLAVFAAVVFVDCGRNAVVDTTLANFASAPPLLLLLFRHRVYHHGNYYYRCFCHCCFVDCHAQWPYTTVDPEPLLPPPLRAVVAASAAWRMRNAVVVLVVVTA